MRSLTFVGPGTLEWREAPRPAIDGPDQALIEPLAVATCDLDVLLLRGRMKFFGGDFPLGHECVGRVLEVSEDAGSFKPGDLVIPSFQICCGGCVRCRKGLTGNCEKIRGTAMYGIGARGGNWGGALSDVLKVPFASGMLVKPPDALRPADIASISDNVADAWRTVAPHLNSRPAAPVMIVGGGSIGLYAVQIAAACGASQVTYFDTEPRRLALAERLGARVQEFAPDRRPGRFPITVSAGASIDGLSFALRSTEPGGVCTDIGIFPGKTTPLPLFDMYIAGITFVTGRVNSRAVLPEVLHLAAMRKIAPEQVTSRVVQWRDAAEALSDPPDKLVIVRE
jgi:threonine dehydrogenase-like Zn-dependent dehydrogenase